MQTEEGKDKIVLEESEKKFNKDIALSADKTYAQAGLNSYLIKCYEQIGYNHPTPIQYYSISTYIQKNPHSIIAQSKSGTGKTLGYISILMTHFLGLKEATHKCSYLVILPTRELSLQVYQAFKQIINVFTIVKAANQEQKQARMKLKQMRVLMTIGGLPFEDDKKSYLTNGGTVVIGTIGRVLEFVQKKLIKMNELEMLILDEGDKLFQNKNCKFSSFLDNALKFHVNQIFKIHFLIYSATFTSKLIQQLNKRRDFTYIQTLASHKDGLILKITTDCNDLIGLDTIIDQNNETNESIINLDNIKKYKIKIDIESQSYFTAKITALIQVLGELNYQRCLVFVEKKTLLEQINERLIGVGLEPLLIHGSLSQSSRIKLMNQINHSKIIIASDLLARGIDLQLDLVILFDAKKNDTFWHRIGRTGRFGSLGVAISLDLIEDWMDYNKEEIQEQLNQISKQFKKNKQWYGTYMTELGTWNETNQEKEVALEAEYKYFDQSKYKNGRKMLKKDPNIQAKTKFPQKQHSHVSQLDKIKSHQDLLLLIQSLLKCQKCKYFMQTISDLTGYQFQLNKYADVYPH